MGYERVLGISLGTRKMGLAILKGDSLSYRAAKAFHGAWSKQKLQKILSFIERLMTAYNIDFIAIKLPRITVPTPTLKNLQTSITQLATAKGVTVRLYTLGEVKKGLDLNIRANKKEFMGVIVERYPELRNRYERELISKVSHYEKLFEAVGVADISYRHFCL